MKPMEFLSRMMGTRLGREIIEQADQGERESEQRKSDLLRYAEVMAERESRLPALTELSLQTLEKAREDIFAAHKKAMAIQEEFYSLDARTAGEMRRLEVQLRSSADPRIREGGKLQRQLAGALAHLLQHGLLNPRQTAERIRFLEKDGGPVVTSEQDYLKRIKQEYDLSERAGTCAEHYESAMHRLSRLPFVEDAKLPHELEALVKGLPTKCPCGARLQVDQPTLSPTLSVVA